MTTKMTRTDRIPTMKHKMTTKRHKTTTKRHETTTEICNTTTNRWTVTTKSQKNVYKWRHAKRLRRDTTWLKKQAKPILESAHRPQTHKITTSKRQATANDRVASVQSSLSLSVCCSAGGSEGRRGRYMSVLRSPLSHYPSTIIACITSNPDGCVRLHRRQCFGVWRPHINTVSGLIIITNIKVKRIKQNQHLGQSDRWKMTHQSHQRPFITTSRLPLCFNQD